MVLRLLGLSRDRGKQAAAPPAIVPAGERFYAIGDIHGRLDLLNELLEKIVADDAARPEAKVHIIFLGDLIDRGPESSGVIARLMALRADRPTIRFLMGNHEEMFLRALDSPRTDAMKFFLRNGGRETLLSYPISVDEYDAGSLEDLRLLAIERVPAAHRDFLAGFEDWIEIGEYLFVHAGIRPGLPIQTQLSSDLRWIRDEFLRSSEDHGRIVVHGHTISDGVEERSNRIGIDTGAFTTGVLTALGAESGVRWYISTKPD